MDTILRKINDLCEQGNARTDALERSVGENNELIKKQLQEFREIVIKKDEWAPQQIEVISSKISSLETKLEDFQKKGALPTAWAERVEKFGKLDW